ncbi:hypothetical protein [Streptomyces noursei]|uniref:hypothetical protein n=1 Tax=Streptomyces noursei TaxID=1971 RepID=UPI0035E2913E
MKFGFGKKAERREKLNAERRETLETLLAQHKDRLRKATTPEARAEAAEAVKVHEDGLARMDRGESYI